MFVSFDITSLYSNISHELGLKAINYWLNKYPNECSKRFNNNFITESILFILKNNTFLFDDIFYRQSMGTAMGTKFAPAYATLVIGYLEELLYEKLYTIFPPDISNYIIQNWRRYLDDCFIIWQNSKNDLEKFYNLLNNLDHNINFTMDFSESELPFLDVLIVKNGKNIQTDIFHKETDSQLYLPFTSCHPRHTKTNVPFTLAKRYKTIISENTTLNYRMDELKINLLKQNYPNKSIDFNFNKVHKLNRADLLKRSSPSAKTNNNNIIFLSTQNPRNPNFFQIIRNNISMLNIDKNIKELLEKHSILNSKRQPKNLKKLLTSAKFKNDKKEIETKKCNRGNCCLCTNNEFLEASEINFNNGKNFKIYSPMSCSSKNIIYVIICNNCQLEYIGETGDTLRHRFNVHRNQIKNEEIRKLLVSKHIYQCAKNKTPNYKVVPIYKFNDNTTETERRIKEQYFIKQFKPALNPK